MNDKRHRALLTRGSRWWLGGLIAAAQLPHIGHLPWWLSLLGLTLTAARLSLPHERKVSPWLMGTLGLAVGGLIDWQFGYFLGRDPCIAFLFVLLGIKFMEGRLTRDGMLLVCLALFLTLTQFFFSQTVFAALAAAPVLLLLGATLASLRHERLSKDGPWWEPLRATGVLLVQGVPLAAFLFVLFPRIAGPLWGLPADAGAKTGLSDRMAPGSISQLSLSDEVAFRVDFAAAPPRSRLLYWRGPVLSRFDGREWSMYAMRPAHDPARDRSSKGGIAIDYTVTLEPHYKQWLFALEFPVGLPHQRTDADSIAAGGSSDFAQLSADRQLLAKAPVTQPLQYVQRSILNDSYAPDAATERASNLQLSRGNPKTIEFAHALRESVGSDRAYIDAVLSWFRREHFVYTLSPPLLAKNATDMFLFDTKSGFCEHYAGAFALLLRAAGIPARVVTGYQGGEINPNGGYLIVRQSDAHAWTEALLDGRWQRFDPTAAVSPSRIESGLGAALPIGEPVPYLARAGMTWLKQLRLHWDQFDHSWQRGVVGFNAAQQRSLLEAVGFSKPHPWQLMATLGACVFVWAGLVLYWLRHPRATLDPTLWLWAKLSRHFGRAGYARAPHEAPLAYALRLRERWPELSDALDRIVRTYTELRYGVPDRTAGAQVAALERALTALPSSRVLAASVHR